MDNNRLITVAIHTFDIAQELKALLEREGIDVTLQNVNLDHPVVSSGIRVRIKESDLPFALRIIENQDVFAPVSSGKTKLESIILVPIDFSSHSEKACSVAIKLANNLKSKVHLLHAYSDPTSRRVVPLSDVMTFDSQPNDKADTRRAIQSETTRQIDLLKSSLLTKMKSGELPALKYTTEIREGIPEEAINQYSKENNPLMIVMGTRSSNTKERELVGSVTAEVLDTCRFPVFTVPESIDITNVGTPDKVIFFSNFDQDDILALDTMFRLLPAVNINVLLVSILSKKSSDNEIAKKSLENLKQYCDKHYPQHNFSIESLSGQSINIELKRQTIDSEKNLIAIPNKRKNIFARLFNPSIAHKILFHTDIPMMVIPV